jgi:phosphoglycerate kinase
MENGEVADKSRICATLKTIEWILEKEPISLVIISHMGRPDGQRQEEYSLRGVGVVL